MGLVESAAQRASRRLKDVERAIQEVTDPEARFALELLLSFLLMELMELMER